MDLTPKQQTSEAVRQAETILVLTGQHPSVDQVAAVIGLTMILRKFGKSVTAIMTDNPSPAVNVLDTSLLERNLGGTRDFILKVDTNKTQVETLRYENEGGKLNIYLTPRAGSFAPSDVTFGYGEANLNYDLAIVLGVPTRARIDRVYEQNTEFFASIPTINLDFHRSNENYGAVNLIEPNASSLCEMLVALSESLQGGIIDADIATALLMGIVASTDRFTAAHTSPKSLTVAAQMMAAGAKQQTVVRALYRDGRGTDTRGPERPAAAERPAASERTERMPERSMERTPERRPERPAPSAPAQTQATQAPVQPRPQATNEPADLPIIQPGHIELSEPEAKPVESVATAQAPVTPEPENKPAEPRPQVHPMADFAAASEVFRRADPENDDRSNQEETA